MPTIQSPITDSERALKRHGNVEVNAISNEPTVMYISINGEVILDWIELEELLDERCDYPITP